jgi:DNA-directed RNA polymerase specialized sigma24 family protein
MATHPAQFDDKTLLGSLVARIAGGDRAAFQKLYTRLQTAVCDHVAGMLSRSADVPPVVSSTFVEVWWLAGHHSGSGTDVRTWIASIATARATERERGSQCAGPWPSDASQVALRQLLGQSGTSARATRAISA